MARALALAACLSLALAEDYDTYTGAGKCGSLSYSGEAYDELFTTTVTGSSADECGSLCEASLGDSLVSVSASYDPSSSVDSVDCTCHSLCECLTDLDDPYLIALYYPGYALPSACDATPTAAPAASTDGSVDTYETYDLTSYADTLAPASSTLAPTTTPITELCADGDEYVWSEVAVAGATYTVVTIPSGLGKVSLKVSGYAVEDVAVVKANETLPTYTAKNATDSACDASRPYWAHFDEHCSACSGRAALKVETVFFIEGLLAADYGDDVAAFFKASVDDVLAASYGAVYFEDDIYSYAGRKLDGAAGRKLEDAVCQAYSACGCSGSEFCNFDYGSYGGCEPCASHSAVDSCYSDGLPDAGAADCAACCFDGTSDYYEAVTGSASPVDGIKVTNYSTPALADLDGDGDLDLVVGDTDGALFYYENVGTPALADLDGDGDLDLVVGEEYGALYYFENVGSATSPSFEEVTGDASPFYGNDVGWSSWPAIGDIDGDGDLDLVVGEWGGTLFFLENVGSAASPSYADFAYGDASPFYGINVGNYSAPALGDIDGDGDLDLREPFDGIDVGGYGTDSTPGLGDLDGDGDLDLVVGEWNGELNYYEAVESTSDYDYDYDDDDGGFWACLVGDYGHEHRRASDFSSEYPTATTTTAAPASGPRCSST
ncbi:DNA-directed 5'-3' RNA polymerase [Aureococcus anophagefferens]|nr:DNA-directed 5'-3' RNA polymerase [Aureococcus anophagefferens]